jgi:hypothetical protein
MVDLVNAMKSNCHADPTLQLYYIVETRQRDIVTLNHTANQQQNPFPPPRKLYIDLPLIYRPFRVVANVAKYASYSTSLLTITI